MKPEREKIPWIFLGSSRSSWPSWFVLLASAWLALFEPHIAARGALSCRRLERNQILARRQFGERQPELEVCRTIGIELVSRESLCAVQHFLAGRVLNLNL